MAPQAARTARLSADGALAELFAHASADDPAQLDAVVADVVARWLGASAAVWVVDHEERCLLALAAAGGGRADDRVNVEGTLAGRAYREEQPVVHTDAVGTRVWVQVVHGADRIGVLEVAGSATLEAHLDELARLAQLVAVLLVVGRGYSDAHFRLRRRQRMTLSADLQWAQLPPAGGRHGHTTYAGVLEPAYMVAGDAFDHSVNGHTLHAAVFDALGHNLTSALISHLVLGTYRHARRLALALPDIYMLVDDTVIDQFGVAPYSTGVVVELDLRTGTLAHLNIGHPLPMVLRHGKVLTLEAAPVVPFGLGRQLGREVHVAHHALEPGDRLLLYTDGVVEGRTPDGVRFSEAALADLLVRSTASDMSTAETLRRLIGAVLAHQNDQLRDDGTMLLIDWNPSPP